MLELSHIGKSFGHAKVLDDLSVRFEPGTVTAILGDNGAGKSTLLKIISGLHAPDAGQIHLAGEAVTGLAAGARRRRGIEMIYQDLALARQQSVLANLYLGREATLPIIGWLNRRRMRQVASERLQAAGLHARDLDRRVELLSGGQQQSVAIARAAMFDPKVLLLDEPTAALGPRQVDLVLDEIRRERAAGRVLILVSHRFNDVFAVADRIMVMKHGRIASDLPAARTSIAATVETIVG